MKLKTIFKACQNLCERRIKEKPQAGVVIDGEKVPYTELKESLKRLQDWCYPMDTNALKIQICCKDCEHYKRFKHVRDKRDRRTVLLCELDKSPKTKEHYCGYAVPKKTTSSVETVEAEEEHNG